MRKCLFGWFAEIYLLFWNSQRPVSFSQSIRWFDVPTYNLFHLLDAGGISTIQCGLQPNFSLPKTTANWNSSPLFLFPPFFRSGVWYLNCGRGIVFLHVSDKISHLILVLLINFSCFFNKFENSSSPKVFVLSCSLRQSLFCSAAITFYFRCGRFRGAYFSLHWWRYYVPQNLKKSTSNIVCKMFRCHDSQ